MKKYISPIAAKIPKPGTQTWKKAILKALRVPSFSLKIIKTRCKKPANTGYIPEDRLLTEAKQFLLFELS